MQVKTAAKEGYDAVQVGATNKRADKVTHPLRMHFAKHKVKAKRVLMEFRVTPNALLPTGTWLNAAHFTPGQYVDACATSIGKGFQGPMKRWNFGGLPASHGVSVSHRSHGATGQRQDPGRVFKGKKMAGHLGNERCTVQSLQVFKVRSHQKNNPDLLTQRKPGRHAPQPCLCARLRARTRRRVRSPHGCSQEAAPQQGLFPHLPSRRPPQSASRDCHARPVIRPSHSQASIKKQKHTHLLLV